MLKKKKYIRQQTNLHQREGYKKTIMQISSRRLKNNRHAQDLTPEEIKLLNVARVILYNDWSISGENLLEYLLQFSGMQACQLQYIDWLDKMKSDSKIKIPESLLIKLQSAYLFCENLGFADYIYLDDLHLPKVQLENDTNTSSIEK